ncbi:hypothetical protein BayCH28_12705 [Mycolicibacterium sp. CH28]|uniref:hypothetical protein n=1 Tax=Mycolicibacterium sp. CH28 TaxID=2512237 RepID=UPI001080AA0E|nr:hypothetical protein [Mycolicibacterium sp. CH28]TGD88565.1 hypothetical protein BayCH28_12705 [Mycolicibacterium sp. CH28]
MANTGWRVVIQEGNDARAICKIQALSDGGYSVIAPYHSAKEGWLTRQEVDYRQTHMEISFSDVEHFDASDRVKLSHHWDGFVQFSGENPQKIRSGRDPLTGQPKGLAIMSAPIWRPITSGPTFGATMWGLEEFKAVTEPRESDVIFGPDQLYYRECTPTSCNAYLIEGWVFDVNMWAGVRGHGNNLRLSLGLS